MPSEVGGGGLFGGEREMCVCVSFTQDIGCKTKRRRREEKS